MSSKENNSKTKIAIIEDDAIIRQAIIEQIVLDDRFEIVAEGESVAEGRNIINLRPHLYILDLGLIDGSGIEIIETIRAIDFEPQAKILVLTLYADEKRVLEALKKGADGYVLKEAQSKELIKSLEEIMGGKTPISPKAAKHLLDSLRSGAKPETAILPRLSARELELLQYLAKGFDYKSCAQILSISPNTVANHIKNLYKKLNVKSVTEAVYIGLKTKIIGL